MMKTTEATARLRTIPVNTYLRPGGGGKGLSVHPVMAIRGRDLNVGEGLELNVGEAPPASRESEGSTWAVIFGGDSLSINPMSATVTLAAAATTAARNTCHRSMCPPLGPVFPTTNTLHRYARPRRYGA
jgi:hypothetical protein